MDTTALVEKAKAARAPNSRFSLGAALECRDSEVLAALRPRASTGILNRP